jgi:acyl carrier protein
MDSDFENTKQKVKRELSDYLGIDASDVDDDSILAEDFHMKPNDLTDFMEILTTAGFDTSKIELTEIETFEDLVEAVTAHE